MISLRHTLVFGAVPAAFGLFLCLALARNSGVLFGLPLDDAWIHAAFARHLAQDGSWTLFAGGARGGESSPLWPLILSLGELGGRSLAPRLALLLGGVSWLFLPGCVGCLASTPTRGKILAVTTALCPPLLFLSLSGMETIPALLCGVLALHAFGQGHGRRAALWAAMACLLRPDALLLFMILAVGEIDHARGRGHSLLSALGEAFEKLWIGIPIALLGLIGLTAVEGHFPPATLEGRRWLVEIARPEALASHLTGIAFLGLDWARALVADIGWGRWSASHLENGRPLLLLLWKFIFAGTLFTGLIRLIRHSRRDRTRAGARLLLVWTLWMLLIYGWILPDRGHAGRYQPQVLLIVAWLTVEGLAELFSIGRWTRWGQPLLWILLGGGLLTGFFDGAVNWGRAVDHINGVHRKAALELPLHLTTQDAVAIFDVGTLAYMGFPGRLMDLSGLSDPEIIQSIRAGHLLRRMENAGITHVLLPRFQSDGPGSLRDHLGLMEVDGCRLEEIAIYESPPERWAEAFQFCGNAFRQLALYQLEVDPAEDSPSH